MKSNIITAAIILTGCLCAWGYLAAQSDVPYSSQFIQTLPLPSQTAQPNNPPSTFASPQTTYPTNPSITDEPPSPTTGPYYGGQPFYGSSSYQLTSPLLVIKEPSLEDFEQCAQRAVGFMESVGSEIDEDKMVNALHELYDMTDLPDYIIDGFAPGLKHLKKEAKNISQSELIARKSFGRNIIILYYHQYTDKWPIFHRFTFERKFDQDGESLKWQCTHYTFYGEMEKVISAL